MKRVWLNINTGEFSNTWEKGSDGDDWVDSLISGGGHINEGWKLIEYKCLNDQTFELYRSMSITTSPHLLAKKVITEQQ